MLEQVFRVYTLSQLQDLAAFLKLLEVNSISSSVFVDYVNQQVALFVATEEKLVEVELSKRRLCDCGTHMLLYPVNNTPAVQTGDNSRSVWYCPNCFEQVFMDETVDEIQRRANGNR